MLYSTIALSLLVTASGFHCSTPKCPAGAAARSCASALAMQTGPYGTGPYSMSPGRMGMRAPGMYPDMVPTQGMLSPNMDPRAMGAQGMGQQYALSPRERALQTMNPHQRMADALGVREGGRQQQPMGPPGMHQQQPMGPPGMHQQQQQQPSRPPEMPRDTVLISTDQRLPANAQLDAAAILGPYVQSGQSVNGKPVYTNEVRPKFMLWWMRNGDWCIGESKDLGSRRCIAYTSSGGDSLMPHDIDGRWMMRDNGAGWVCNVAIKVESQGPLQPHPSEPPAAANMPPEQWRRPEPPANNMDMAQGAPANMAQGAQNMPPQQWQRPDMPPEMAHPSQPPVQGDSVARRLADKQFKSPPPGFTTPVGSVASSRPAAARDAAAREHARMHRTSAGPTFQPPPTQPPTAQDYSRQQRPAPTPPGADQQRPPSSAEGSGQAHAPQHGPDGPPVDAYEERVAMALDFMGAANEAKYHELIRPALDAYAKDMVDMAALELCKINARKVVDADNEELAALQRAYETYREAVSAQEAAAAAMHEAEFKLDAALCAIESRAAAPPDMDMGSGEVEGVEGGQAWGA